MSELSNISFNEVCDRLSGATSVLILTHARPDGDTLGSGFALRELLRGLGKNAHVINADPMPRKLGFIFGVDSLAKETLPENFTPDLVVSVDVSAAKLLGDYEEEFAPICDLAIDHHVMGTPFAKETYVGDTGACGEIIADMFDYFEKCGHSLLTKPAATALYAAICSDTGSFKYESVTEKTHLRIAKLMAAGIDHAEICRRLYDSRTKTQVVATKAALNTLEFYHNSKIAVVYFTNQMLTDNGLSREDIDDIIGLARGIEGVEVGVAVKQNEKDPSLYKVSMRSSRVCDVSKLCALFGGGGHVRAGGCSVVADSVSEAVKTLVDAISKELTELEENGAFEGVGEL